MSGTFDEAVVRLRVAEIADTCGSCQRCLDHCGVFPKLVDLVVERDGGSSTPAEQDDALDGCFQCGRCLDGCPYGPGVHDTAVDVGRAAHELRGAAVVGRRVTMRDRLGDRLLGRPDVVGRLCSGRLGWLARPVLRGLARAGAVEMRVAGRRRRSPSATRSGRPGSPEVLVFSACPTADGDPATLDAVVELAERAGSGARIVDLGCCGAPWLHSGDLARFDRTVRRTANRAAAELDDRTVVVVPQPSCADALRRVAPSRLSDTTIASLAERVRDPLEHLGERLGTDEPTDRLRMRVVHHVACRSVDGGASVVDLLGRLGAEVTVVSSCSGVGDEWGARRRRRRQVDAGVETLGEALAGAQDRAWPDPSDNGDASTTTVVTTECLHTAQALERAGFGPVWHPTRVVEHMYGDGSKLPLADPSEPF